MSEETRPSTTGVSTNVTLTPSSNEPEPETTSLLSDPEESAFYTQDTVSTSKPFSPAETNRALLTESRFSRSREQDEADALASLDKTILRPAALYPQEADPREQLPRNAEYVPLEPAPSTSRAHVWRRRAAIALVAAVAVAAVGQLTSPRKSNVGIFGVNPTVEQAAAPSEDERDEKVRPEVVPSQSEEEEAGSSELFSEESEPREEPSTSEEPSRSEEPELLESEPVIEAKPLETENNRTDSSEPTYPDWVYQYNTPHSQTDETTTQQDWSDSITTDDHSLTYNFDGGNVTYHYDDGTVTFDFDALDGYGHHPYDPWGYGAQEWSWWSW